MAKIYTRALSALASLRAMNMSRVTSTELFLPPVNRSMKELNKSFFQKSIPISVATIFDRKNIVTVRNILGKSRETLDIKGLKNIFEDDSSPGARCLLLDTRVKHNEPASWSSDLSKLVEDGTVQIRPFDLKLTYDDFSMSQILEAVLPESIDEDDQTPTGFAQVGHVAHVNLRSPYLPYKFLIGEVLADKNSMITTVINKTLDVGKDSVYRTFPYEVLYGKDDLKVTVSESSCEYSFDFAKVYWNSRLGTEHERMVSRFNPGEAVCDVMAGVGPFALPAGKKRVFVRANDLNPDSFASLAKGIVKNKVAPFVQASCEDGRAFIRNETARLKTTQRTWVKPPPKVSRKLKNNESTPNTQVAKEPEVTLQEPASFDHYVMNLPATAAEFLDAFTGVYHGRETEFHPHTNRELPMIHVYTFQEKRKTEEEEKTEICQKISRHLNYEITLSDQDLEIELWNVRLVSPGKWMYCASFRLPPAVAFAQPSWTPFMQDSKT